MTSITTLDRQGLISAIALCTILYFLGLFTYRLFFHSLAKVPGPRLAAISDIYYIRHWLCVRYPFVIGELHKKYEHVVRIAPNDVSFDNVEAWKEIYGHASGGKGSFLKSKIFYRDDQHPGIVSVIDGHEHARQRKSLSNAFSARSLREQEPIVRQYVDSLIQLVGSRGSPSGPGFNVVHGFDWLTFDIISTISIPSVFFRMLTRINFTSDLTFGKSFGAVAGAKDHPWVSILIESSFAISLATTSRRIPLLKLALPFMLPKDIPQKLARHNELSREKTLKRVKMAEEVYRPDFFQQILCKGGDRVHFEELVNQTIQLITAGSETTATFLSSVTFHLLKNRPCLDELTREVRSAFRSPGEINADRCSELKYLNAVIEEGLRIWPPLPFGQSRESPGAVVSGVYLPPGTVCSVDMWSVHRNPKYWTDPYSFRPERWLGEGLGDNKAAFYPFILGPRACLGINLAYLEMRIIFALLVFTYDWETANPDLDFWNDARATLFWVKSAVMVRFHPRKQ